MHFTRSLSPILFNYKLNDCNLTTSGQHSYLGILLDNKLSWSSHIKNTSDKTLNFLKRNLSSCSPEVKASAYLTMICPVMEYAVVVWDPYYQTDIQQLEAQHRAARWVLNDFSRYVQFSHKYVTTAQSQICYNSFLGQVSKYVVRYVGYKHYLQSSTMSTLYLSHPTI